MSALWLVEWVEVKTLKQRRQQNIRKFDENLWKCVVKSKGKYRYFQILIWSKLSIPVTLYDAIGFWSSFERFAVEILPTKAGVRTKMGKTFQAYLPDCYRTYSCIHCRAHLANHDELISKVWFFSLLFSILQCDRKLFGTNYLALFIYMRQNPTVFI